MRSTGIIICFAPHPINFVTALPLLDGLCSFIGGSDPKEIDSRGRQPGEFDLKDMSPAAEKFVERVQNPIIVPCHSTAPLTTPPPVTRAATITTVMASTMTGYDSLGCAVELVVIPIEQARVTGANIVVPFNNAAQPQDLANQAKTASDAADIL